MESNRREFIGKSALLAGTAAVGLSACTGTGTGGISLTKDVIDAVQAEVAKVCSYVPQVATIIAIVSNFPALNGATTIAQELLTSVSTFLCHAFQNAGGTEAVLAGKTMKMSAASGETPIHGLLWDAKSEKFVQF